MPPAPKRNRILILFDLQSQNLKELRQLLLKIYLFHHLRFNDKNLINLILVNSSRTENRLSLKKFLHLFEVDKNAVSYDATKICSQIEVEATTPEEYCVFWKKAVRLALKILQEDTTRNIITKQILYLTDLKNIGSLDFYEEKWQDIDKDLKRMSGFLYFVGPNVTFNRTIEKFEDLKDFNPEFSREYDNLKEIKRLMEKNANVTVSNVKIGFHLFFGYKNHSGKQPWNVPLTIGSKIFIPVSTSKLLDKTKGFTLVSGKKSHYKEYIFVDAANAERVFPECDVRKGLIRHGKFIPCENNSLFKKSHQRTFSILYATELKNLPEYMMKGPACYITFKNPKTRGKSFSIILSQLKESNKCLIVKRIYSKGCNPMYMALIPDEKLNAMIAVQLPYAHTVQMEYPEIEPEKDLEKVSLNVENYLDSLTINSPKCLVKIQLTPRVATVFKGNALLNMTGDKFFKESLRLNELDIDIFDTQINPEVGKELRAEWESRKNIPVEQSLVYDLESDKEDFF